MDNVKLRKIGMASIVDNERSRLRITEEIRIMSAEKRPSRCVLFRMMIRFFIHKRASILKSGEVNSSSSNLCCRMAPVFFTLLSRWLVFVIGFANTPFWRVN